MNEPSIQELLREGIAAAKLAQQESTSANAVPARGIRRLNPGERTPRERARELLLQVVERDDQLIPAWLWLSTVMDRREEQQICLENVLMLDPENKPALAGLARLGQQGPAEPEPDLVVPAARPVRRKYSPLKSSVPVHAQPAQTKPAGLACPFCQQSISSIDKLCPHCQLPLIMNCPACDREVDVEWATCQGCQQRIGDYGQPVTYFAQLGAAYRQKGQHQAAAKAWQAVELLQPDYPQLQLRLGEAYVGIGRPDRAWASLQQALKQNPDAAELHFALGELTRQRGEREEAFKHYQKATQLDPQYGLAWFQVGQIYQQVRRHKEALQAYRQAVKLLPAGSDEYHQAQSHLERLSPGLPESMATGWSELIRQMTGPVTLCVLAALLDSGLRPWWIPLGGWLALALAVSGAFLYVSGTDLPRNPVIRVLAGERGLSSGDLKISLAVVGAILWLIGLALILLPVGQAYPEPPQL